MDLDISIISLLIVAILALWIKFIKTGPVCMNPALLAGKTVVVTGGNVGIGKATAIELAKRKARVIIACRNEDKAMKALEEIKRESGSELVHYMKLDLADFDSIKRFVDEWTETEVRLDILINNAATFNVGRTVQGYDLMFGTNQLGPFLLINLLMPTLKKQAEQRPVRIVNLSSIGYKIGKFDLNNLDPFRSTPNPNSARVFMQYNSTKLMNVYLTTELNKRLRTDNPEARSITTYAVHPGAIRSQLGADYAEPSMFSRSLRRVLEILVTRSEYYGCQTTLYCCLTEGIEHLSGKYFSGLGMEELMNHATDPEIGKLLWEKCEELTGLTKLSKP